MKKTVIIFGSSGQDGFYLNNLLEKENIKVIKISRTSGDYIGSVGNFEFVDKLIREIKPDFVFHLAANSTTKHYATLDNNISISTGTINLLESIRLHSINTKIFISGSALQFKNNGLPISEDTEFDYSSTYSISRIYSVNMARYYRQKFGLKIYIGYFFNHDSEFRSDDFINQKIVKHLVKVLNGSNEKLIISDLDYKKEFNFAGDIVNAVWLLINQNLIYEAIIGSGKAYSIGDWVKYCFNKFSLNWENYIATDKKYTSDFKILVSDPKIIYSLGWKPKINFYELADLMIQSEFLNFKQNN